MCIGTLFVFAAALIFERDDVDKVKDANGKVRRLPVSSLLVLVAFVPLFWPFV